MANFLERWKRGLAEYRGIPALRIRFTDGHGLKRKNTEQNSDKWQVESDKSSITNLARRLRRLTQILLRYKNILVLAMPAYELKGGILQMPE